MSSSISRPSLCILSLVIFRSISAFQSQTTNNCPTHRTIATGVSSNEDPSAEIFGVGEDSLVDTASQIIDATSSITDSASFGESVPFIPLTQRSQRVVAIGDSDGASSAGSDNVEAGEIVKRNGIRNVAVAVASFLVAVSNYGWQFSHPVTAIEILASMEKQSAPLTAIGNNGKPTVIDFWAPWCENCRVGAPTLQAVEEEYGDRVNFISVNADEGNWPLLQLFGVDAIPHLALLSGEGDVETALIGPMSRNVLRSDLDALLSKREELPYKMFDAFGSRQDGRRINFVER